MDTLTSADKILKDWYWGDKVSPQMITDTPLLNKIKATKDHIVNNVGGRQVIFGIKYAYGQGRGSRNAGDPLPQARNLNLYNSKFPMKKMISHVEIQGEAWRATEGAGAKSFINLIREETNDALEGHAKELNQILYGDGTGLMAAATTGVVSGLGTASFTVNDIRRWGVGMLVDVETTGGSSLATDQAVTDVDRTTSTVTIDRTGLAYAITTGGAGVGSNFYRAGSKNKELMGLRGIVDDGSVLSSLQNITVSTNSWWKATELDNAGTARAISLDLMERAWNASMQQNNVAPDSIFMDFTQKRKYEQLLVSDKRYVQERDLPTLDGGYGKLSYNNTPIYFDTDCNAGTVYFLQTKFLKLFQQFGYQWVSSPDKSNIWDRKDGFDAYEAVAIYEGEFACDRRNVHSKITDLILS